MHFEVAGSKVVEKLNLSQTDLTMCINDANIIAQVFNAAFKENNSLFGDIFAELNRTAIFFKGKSVDLMPDFNYAMPFKLPFKVKPIFRYNGTANLLRLKSKAKHPIVVDGFVSASKFHGLLRSHIIDTINGLKTVTCGSDDDIGGPRVYRLFWRIGLMREDCRGHAIMAQQLLGSAEGTPIDITFNYMPVFKFLMYESPLPNNIAEDVEGARYWTVGPAYIYANTFVFLKITPRWQLLKPEDKVVARNIVRLFTAIGKKHEEDMFFDADFPKHALYWLLQEREASFKTTSMMTIFVGIFRIIIKKFKKDVRPLRSLLGHLDDLRRFRNIEEMYETLKIGHDVQYIDPDAMLKMFGLLDVSDIY